MKTKRKVIVIDEAKCNGCGVCVPSCAEGALAIVDTPGGPKVRLVGERLCDGLGACLGECPEGALTIEEREADAFDEAAAKHHHAPHEAHGHAPHAGHGHAHHGGHGEPACPSARTMQWGRPGEKKGARGPAPAGGSAPSRLRQWPVQLHLVSPLAPYLRDADLLLVADCVPFAYGGFHEDFLAPDGVAIAIACPKLDDTSGYVQKLAAMIATGGVRSLTVLHMEVPCCGGLVRMAAAAIRAAGRQIPLTAITVGIEGEVKGRAPVSASTL